jgi:hypothetical protein
MAKVTPPRVAHPRSLLAGGLGVLSSLLAIGWALFGCNLPTATNLASSQPDSLMLAQFCVAFVVLIGSGLMLARYTRLGGTINILGGLATFGLGVLCAQKRGTGSESCESPSDPPPLLAALYRTPRHTSRPSSSNTTRRPLSFP